MKVSTDPTYLKELKERCDSSDPKLLERFLSMEGTIREFFQDPYKFALNGWDGVRIGCYLLGVEQLDTQLFPKHPSGETYLNRKNPIVVHLVDQAEKWLEENGKCLIDGEVR